jgi:hypothetical protein
MSVELFVREIGEQPAALRALLADEAAVAEVGRALDYAASYAVGLLAGWNAMRDSISLSVYYGADLPYRDSAVLALSQSGGFDPDRPAGLSKVTLAP